ncbi:MULTISPECIES: folylpolyglutamate synthase/dihydrofolate synthase family protein [unclassified Actinomyces]|uniref:bifunctional folylpolyglutamate synthase/dihydrofolate synthase n=1 Tax=unclassified Actinomyces TaxID=2609248 RepID=UPI0013A6BB57|nr:MULTISPECIES: folylpolyglutamate synthase/dihydrofolate synthase family protein [unclassified Actinomyces]MBW3069379.1 bifunctional folylpolyglutamate synthase/dihydrofolate synthase [Actinomyces sp. 594]NDR53742.1 bifunctional folylpolyglutamate synthase/dihydrofolate synthase [Actinomyces sp. 565]
MSSKQRDRDAHASGQTESHPGAAFGIPAGASGEDVVDAVYGPGGTHSGIDPELLPYLEAADSPEGKSLAQAAEDDAAAEHSREQAEAEDLAALRELVAANMVPGGDLERLDALLAEVDADESDDWEDWEPVLPDVAGNGSAEDSPGADAERHRAELTAAARAVEVSARMREVEAEILSRAPEHQVQPSLERVEAVLDILGNPERNYRIVHVAGTNGKTSTARMTERLLAATGMRTGRFTSPHLATIRERIALDGEPISEEGFIAAWEDVAPYVEMVDARSQAAGGPRLSFFEVLTVMALAAFADHPVDVAVIETGMGGTWDSTNVVPGDVEVITPIGLDHAAWLGATVEEVAANKAGIIKDGATLVTAAQPESVQAVIAAAAVEHQVIWRRELDPEEDPGAPDAGVLRVVDRTLGVGGQMATFATAAGVYEDVFVPLYGDYQAHNALLALAAAEAVFGGRQLPAKIVEDGFASVTSPGRLEVLRSSPTVIVDAGHNPHGVTALSGAVEEAFGFQHLVAVVGLMGDKDAEGILSVLEPVCDAVVCVPVESPRAMDAEDLGAVAREVFGADRVVVAPTLAAGVEQAVSLSEGFDAPLTASGVLVVGSVVLAAQARALFGRP